ncbi:putative inorganic phosphate cotransporter [Diprion similis]|uniref:putative inorganic phosphate cotransporter n=1 Tax=Diprion similis TaxID=362088 RepID=UPI001EF7969F|nr:putative inorganic phosphate cotransporter [Diprion similis]
MLLGWKICCRKVQQRWVLAFMGCLAAANTFMMRTCLSVAIIAMVTKPESSNDTSSDDTCSASDLTSSTSSTSGAYEWSEYTQGIILSSFFWGYMVAQIPGGIAVAKFGGKYPLGIGLLLAGVLTLLTPTVVEAYGAKGLIVLRILMGLSGGAIYPSFSFLTGHWAPPNERSKIGSMIMSGSLLGTIVANALSGVLIENSSIGWPIVFYFFGGFSVLWFCAWTLFCYSRPEIHPFITDEEKKYLEETINEVNTGKQGKKQPIPWRCILSSPPFWALVAASLSHDWGSYVMITNLPKYMSSVLKFSVQSNGLLSALPFMAKWIVSNASSWLADWLITEKKISRRNARKTFTSIGGLGMAIFLIGASYAGCSRTVVVVLFVLGMGVLGNLFPGVMVNNVDLSPNHAETLMGITNTITSLASIAAPYAVGVLTPNQFLSEWRIVFWITFALFFTTTLIFDIWGDAEVQPWNDLESVDREQKVVGSGKRKDEEWMSSSE